MKKYIIIMLSLFILSPLAYGAVLSPDKIVDWGNNAGVTYTIPTYPVGKTACNSGCDYTTHGDDVTDDSTIIQECLNNAGEYKACWLKTGTYKITSSLTLQSNTVLAGDGPTFTKMKLYGANTSLSVRGASVGVITGMASGATNWTKGSQTISVTNPTSLNVNDYIMVRQNNLSSCANSNGRCTYSGTHTGGNGATTLTDSARLWTANQWAGYNILNYTAFAIGTITENTSTTLNTTLISNYTPAGRTTWNTGDKYYIYPAGNNYAIPTLKEGYDYFGMETSQIVKIVGKSGNDITINRPLYVPYDQSLLPEVFKITPAVNAGIEDLYVEKDETSGSNIVFDRAVNCWIKNVESYKAYNYHIYLSSSYGCIVRDSYIHDAWSYGGNAGYGVRLADSSVDNLIENNILYHCRHALLLEIGNNGNIFGYNYSKDPMNESDPMDYLMIDACVHGGGNYMNLYEGNIVAHIGSDNATGGSKYNTFFRNWVTRNHSYGIKSYDQGGIINYPWAVDIQKDSIFTNMIGNVFNTPGVQSNLTISWGCDQNDCNAIDTRSKGTTTQCGNYDLYSGAYQEDNVACGETIPNSLYLTSKPPFFGTCAWPAIGPDIDGYVKDIPAKKKFETGTLGCTGPYAPRHLRDINPF